VATNEKEKDKISLAPIVGGLLGIMMLFMMVSMMQAAVPSLPYCCPYCGQCFATYDELVAHVQAEHPGEQISPFAYSNAKAGNFYIGNDYGYTDALFYECDISNLSQDTRTLSITLWSRYLPTGDEYNLANVAANRCKDGGYAMLTLASGESYHYRYCESAVRPEDKDQFVFWLVDEAGGKSPEKQTLSTQ
jgi:hypothetical protein